MWFHTWTWVFSCEFAAYFKNTFYQEHLWASASVTCYLEKNVFSTVDPSYNELWRGHGILFDIIAVRKWVKKIRKLRFSQFGIFFLYCVCFKIFILSLFLFMVAILQRSNKWRRIKYLVRTQISVLGNFIFWRFNNSSVPNKQTWKLKIDRLVGSS